MRIRSIKYRIREDASSKWKQNQQQTTIKSQSSHQYIYTPIKNQSNFKKIKNSQCSTIPDADDMTGKGTIQILKRKCLSKYAEQEKQNFLSFSQHGNSNAFNGLNSNSNGFNSGFSGFSKSKVSQANRLKSSSNSFMQHMPLPKKSSVCPSQPIQPTQVIESIQPPYISGQNLCYQLSLLQTTLTNLSTQLDQQKEKSTNINKEIDSIERVTQKYLGSMREEFGASFQALRRQIQKTYNQKAVLMLNWKDTIQQKQQQYIYEQQQIMRFQSAVDQITQQVGTQLIGLSQYQPTLSNGLYQNQVIASQNQSNQ